MGNLLNTLANFLNDTVRPSRSNVFNCHNLKGSKLLTKLRLGLRLGIFLRGGLYIVLIYRLQNWKYQVIATSQIQDLYFFKLLKVNQIT